MERNSQRDEFFAYPNSAPAWPLLPSPLLSPSQMPLVWEDHWPKSVFRRDTGKACSIPVRLRRHGVHMPTVFVKRSCWWNPIGLHLNVEISNLHVCVSVVHGGQIFHQFDEPKGTNGTWNV